MITLLIAIIMGILVRRAVCRWLRGRPNKRCEMLRRTAELEKEIYGEWLSSSIPDHEHCPRSCWLSAEVRTTAFVLWVKQMRREQAKADARDAAQVRIQQAERADLRRGDWVESSPTVHDLCEC